MDRTMILDELQRWNPLRLLQKSQEVLQSNYKVTVFLSALEPLLRKKVIEPTPGLETIHFFSVKGDSGREELILSGRFDPSVFWLGRFFKMEKILYRVRLQPVWISRNQVYFKIVGYRLYQMEPKEWDILLYFSRWEPFHKIILLKKIVGSFPSVFSLTDIRHEVRFDLNYFLNKIPDLAGRIKIQRVELKDGNIQLFVISGAILKPFMDFFGPDYLNIDYIEGSHSL